MKMKLFKRIASVVLVSAMLLASYVPAYADIPIEEMDKAPTITQEPPAVDLDDMLLRNTDNTFTAVVRSARAEGRFEGQFFKKDNTLYVARETLLKMGYLSELTDEKGNTVFARVDAAATRYVVPEGSLFEFDGGKYYPFVEAMDALGLNAYFDREYEEVNVLGANSLSDLKYWIESAYADKAYNMWEWQMADDFNADTSRVVSQAMDIGRHLFSLPSTIYNYASGNADYESYRTALWKILLSDLNIQTSALSTFSEGLEALSIVEGEGELAKLGKAFTKKSGFAKELFGEMELAGKAVSVLSKADKALQSKDSMAVIEFYCNVENLNSSLENAVVLINRTGLEGNANLNRAFGDTVDSVTGDKPFWESFLKETGDGIIDVMLGELDYGFNNTLGECMVKVMDECSEAIWGKDTTKVQVDSVITATSNLHIQNAAKKSFDFYNSMYIAEKGPEKKMTALKNMRDITLVYLLAGHNAWKVLNFDGDISVESRGDLAEMEKLIEHLLQFNDQDFKVHQNALNTERCLLARCDQREQTYYYFTWNEESAGQIGGLDFAVEGKDPKGRGLLYKKVFSHMYYKQNGLLVANIRANAKTDPYSRIVETYAMEGTCEIVIKPKMPKTSVAEVGLKVAVGQPADQSVPDLSMYLVTEADGTVCYRIPLPIGSSVSKGEALPTMRLPAEFDVDKELSAKVREEVAANMGSAAEGEADTEKKDTVFTDYVPTGPFNGIHFFNTGGKKYTFRYNDEILAMGYLHLPTTPYVSYAEYKDNFWEEYICQMTVTDRTFEKFYQDEKNLYDDNHFGRIEYPIEGVEEFVVAGLTVKYFPVSFTDSIYTDGATVYPFYVELPDGISMQGWWGLEQNQGKTLDKFEYFILELLGQFTITPAEDY